MLKILAKTLLIFLLVLLTVCVGIYVYLWSLQGKKSDSKHPYLMGRKTPITFAHRGGMNEAPENTFAAFDNAVKEGIDVLELDTRISADGEIVVFHDSTLDRTTDGSGKLEETKLADLKRLDPGSKFSGVKNDFPFKGKGLTIPTLEEVFKRYPDKLINIEHKRTSRQYTSSLCSLIKKYEREEKVIFASVSDEILKDFRRECPGVPTSASAWEGFSFFVLYSLGLSENFHADMDALQIPQFFVGRLIDLDQFVEAAKERNLEVHVFTVNDPKAMNLYRDQGVGGIMSDSPSALAEVNK